MAMLYIVIPGKKRREKPGGISTPPGKENGMTWIYDVKKKKFHT